MIYEKLHAITLPKIGFGTARAGGRIIPNRRRDSFYLTALRSALELGYTHFDTAELYALGHSEELIGRAMRETGVRRDEVFITSKAWLIHLGSSSIVRACENSLRRLGMEYMDLYLIHMPNPFIPLAETFRGLNQLVREGKVRHIGVSNFGLALLKKSQLLSESPIITNQIPYGINRYKYAANGVIGYCQENNILVTAYTPLNHGKIKVDGALESISEAHHATPHQIALAWLISQPRVITIPMSFNSKHQKENLAAADIRLTPAEMEELGRTGR